jgi:hypothetical protein
VIRRKTKAFEYTEEKGIGRIIGWFISWPAEAAKGFMISSLYSNGYRAIDLEGPSMRCPGMVYPPELQSG